MSQSQLPSSSGEEPREPVCLGCGAVADIWTEAGKSLDLSPGQLAALVELHETRTDWNLSKRVLSSLRAGVELRGEHLAAGETKALASAGLITVERPMLGATLYSITEAGSALVAALSTDATHG